MKISFFRAYDRTQRNEYYTKTGKREDEEEKTETREMICFIKCLAR